MDEREKKFNKQVFWNNSCYQSNNSNEDDSKNKYNSETFGENSKNAEAKGNNLFSNKTTSNPEDIHERSNAMKLHRHREIVANFSKKSQLSSESNSSNIQHRSFENQNLRKTENADDYDALPEEFRPYNKSLTDLLEIDVKSAPHSIKPSVKTEKPQDCRNNYVSNNSNNKKYNTNEIYDSEIHTKSSFPKDFDDLIGSDIHLKSRNSDLYTYLDNNQKNENERQIYKKCDRPILSLKIATKRNTMKEKLEYSKFPEINLNSKEPIDGRNDKLSIKEKPNPKLHSKITSVECNKQDFTKQIHKKTEDMNKNSQQKRVSNTYCRTHLDRKNYASSSYGNHKTFSKVEWKSEWHLATTETNQNSEVVTKKCEKTISMKFTEESTTVTSHEKDNKSKRLFSFKPSRGEYYKDCPIKCTLPSKNFYEIENSEKSIKAVKTLQPIDIISLNKFPKNIIHPFMSPKGKLMYFEMGSGKVSSSLQSINLKGDINKKCGSLKGADMTSSDDIAANNIGKINPEELLKRKSLLLKYGRDLSDVIVGSYRAADILVSFYDEWKNTRQTFLDIFEDVEKNIALSPQTSKVAGIASAIGCGAKVAVVIPHPGVALAAKIISILSEVISSYFASSKSTTNVNEFQIMQTLRHDIDATSTLYTYGLECSRSFEAACAAIEAFHKDVCQGHFKGVHSDFESDFLDRILDINPQNHSVYCKRLEKCYKNSILQKPTDAVHRAFFTVFEDWPQAANVINLLYWRFNAESGDKNTVEKSWEEIYGLLKNEPSLQPGDILPKIQDCIRILIKEKNSVDRMMKILLNLNIS